MYYQFTPCVLFLGLCVGGVKSHRFQGVQSNSLTGCNLVKNRYLVIFFSIIFW